MRAIILTAIQEEYDAVREHLRDLEEISHPTGTLYEIGNFSSRKAKWRVAVAEIDAGNASAAIEAQKAIEFFSPSAALFVGVAGGIKDVELGDVVVATKVYNYESGKSGSTFGVRPDLGKSSHGMIQRAKAERRNHNWWRRRKGSAKMTNPKVLVKPIAAGEKIVSSKQSSVFKLLRKNYNDAVAVEMEGHGFLAATQAHKNVEALVVRGISDHLDNKGNTDAQGWQGIASCNAAAFAFQVLSKSPLSSSPTIRFEMHIEGTDPTHKEAIAKLLSTLQCISGDDTLKLVSVEKGSVKLTLKGSREGYRRILNLFHTQRLDELLSMHVVAVTVTPTKPKVDTRSSDEIGLGAADYALGYGSADVTKADLVRAVARETKLSVAEARRVLDSILQNAAKGLRIDGRVSITGFGTFTVRRRKARMGRNPQTGDEIKIAASKIVGFKAGRRLHQEFSSLGDD